jgi:hypothetical protein
MRLSFKGVVAAMEEAEAAIVEEGNTELQAAAAETEAPLAEISEAGAEIDSGVENSEQAVNDAETLEKTADVMEKTIESGEGMDETTAEIAEITVESACNRLGITRTKLSIESFGSKLTCLEATRIAKEETQGFASKAYQGIKAFLVRIYEAIKQFILGIFDASQRLINYADKIIEAANKISSEKSDKLAFSSKFAAIVVGTDIKPEICTNILAQVKMFPHVKETMEMIANSCKEELRGKGESFDADMTDESVPWPNGDTIKSKWEATNKALGEMSVGGRHAQVKIEKNSFVMDVVESQDAPELKDVKLLSKADIISVANKVKTLQEEVKKVKAQISAFDKVSKTFGGIADLLVVTVKKASTGKDGEAKKTYLTALRTRIVTATQCDQKFTNYVLGGAMKASKAALEYAHASVVAHGGEKKTALATK